MRSAMTATLSESGEKLSGFLDSYHARRERDDAASQKHTSGALSNAEDGQDQHDD